MTTTTGKIKVIIIGNSDAGKTSLARAFIDGRFTANIEATVGPQTEGRKVINIDGTDIELQIWDTAGQERFQTIIASFWRGTDACLIVYDVSNRKSFDQVPRWVKEAERVQNPNAKFAIVAAKADLERVVTEKEAIQWCKDNGNLPYFETSAKNSINVISTFERIARLVVGAPDVAPAPASRQPSSSSVQDATPTTPAAPTSATQQPSSSTPPPARSPSQSSTPPAARPASSGNDKSSTIDLKASTGKDKSKEKKSGCC